MPEKIIDPFYQTAALRDRENHPYVWRNELEFVIERIKDGRYVSAVAPRQTGKTTFCFHAMDLVSELEEGIIPVHVDLQIAADSSVETILGSGVLYSIKRKLPDNIALPKERTISPLEFHRLFSELKTEHPDLKIALFVEEYAGCTDKVLGQMLRTFRAIHEGVKEGRESAIQSVILADTYDPTDVSFSRSSPYNIGEGNTVFLCDFTAEETTGLLRSGFEKAGVQYDNAALEFIYEQTRGQPILTQGVGSACIRLLNQQDEKKVTTMIAKDAVESLYREYHVNLKITADYCRYAKELVPEASDVMNKILANEPVEFNWAEDRAVRILRTYGMITKGPDGNCQIRNPLYERVFRRLNELGQL